MKTVDLLRSFIKVNKVAFITGGAFALIHVFFMMKVANPPSEEVAQQLNFLLMFVDFPLMCVFELGKVIFGESASPDALFFFLSIFGTIFYFLVGCTLGFLWQWFLTQRNQEYDKIR